MIATNEYICILKKGVVRMKITDKVVIRELNIVRSLDLEESISNYPERERNGRSDMQFLADEVSYRISLYKEETATAEEYEEAQRFLRETSNGKKMPYYATFPPKPKYSELGLQNKTRLAKDIVNEYRRLQALMKRLNDKGYYGRW